jgi:hypothetical protein
MTSMVCRVSVGACIEGVVLCYVGACVNAVGQAPCSCHEDLEAANDWMKRHCSMFKPARGCNCKDIPNAERDHTVLQTAQLPVRPARSGPGWELLFHSYHTSSVLTGALQPDMEAVCVDNSSKLCSCRQGAPPASSKIAPSPQGLPPCQHRTPLVPPWGTPLPNNLRSVLPRKKHCFPRG